MALLPIIIAGFISITASAIAWIYNIKTEEEIQKQERLASEIENILDKISRVKYEYGEKNK